MYISSQSVAYWRYAVYLRNIDNRQVRVQVETISSLLSGTQIILCIAITNYTFIMKLRLLYTAARVSTASPSFQTRLGELKPHTLETTRSDLDRNELAKVENFFS